MAKPILIVKCPMNFPSEELLKAADHLFKSLDSEYHVLTVIVKVVDYEFHVLNAENLDPIDQEDLMKRLTEIVLDQDPKKQG